MDSAHANIVNDLVDIFCTSFREESPIVIFPPALLAGLEQLSRTKARTESGASTYSPKSLNAIGVHIFHGGLSLAILSRDGLAPTVHSKQLLAKLKDDERLMLAIKNISLMLYHGSPDPIPLFFTMVGLIYVKKGCDFVLMWIRRLVRPALRNLNEYVKLLRLLREGPTPFSLDSYTSKVHLEEFWLSICPTPVNSPTNIAYLTYRKRLLQKACLSGTPSPEKMKDGMKNYLTSTDFSKRRRLW
ncbi:uncharacterized protein BT62DRAFT_26804 [Guyanagaster necrorhizus]|uniref:Uncharacterized protein n=1 Tax=Guyanagaster necrorhizus TaxID=856835 RepID=A0A9P7W3L5_9AGAR|nr:uncharacterized protein BT62DRAFT_26804 [Guyanagaster necrorhizus MCA 3950]KAG7452791.1 hypothetical protein BT62DRAFT_26804 [Guyanagaster necrorhizus MCA 3950]